MILFMEITISLKKWSRSTLFTFFTTTLRMLKLNMKLAEKTIWRKAIAHRGKVKIKIVFFKKQSIK